MAPKRKEFDLEARIQEAAETHDLDKDALTEKVDELGEDKLRLVAERIAWEAQEAKAKEAKAPKKDRATWGRRAKRARERAAAEREQKKADEEPDK